MTETQLELIEDTLRIEEAQRRERASPDVAMGTGHETGLTAPAMNDWLRVPHSPLASNSFSFHLPLHRALAKSVRSLCSVVFPDGVRNSKPRDWWKLPIIDDNFTEASLQSPGLGNQHPLAALIHPSLNQQTVEWSGELARTAHQWKLSSAGHVPRPYLRTLLAPKLCIRLQIIRYIVWLLRSRSNGTYGHEMEAGLLAWH
jgi:hypothetical protein